MPNFPFLLSYSVRKFEMIMYSQLITRNSKYFFGIEMDIFKNLMNLARGNKQVLSRIEKSKVDFLTESHIEFEDGTLLCNPYLISFEGCKNF